MQTLQSILNITKIIASFSFATITTYDNKNNIIDILQAGDNIVHRRHEFAHQVTQYCWTKNTKVNFSIGNFYIPQFFWMGNFHHFEANLLI